MKIRINNNLIFNNVIIANSFLEKLVGIIGKSQPVLLKNTNSIHTFFLRKNINAIFIDENNTVIKIFNNIKPNKVIFPIKNTKHILEFCHNTSYSGKINVDDKIEFC